MKRDERYSVKGESTPPVRVRPVTVDMGDDTPLQVFSSRKGSGSWAADRKWGSGYADGTAQALETGQGRSAEKQRGGRRGGSLRNTSEALQGGPDQPKCHLMLSFIGLGQRKMTNVLLSNTLKWWISKVRWCSRGGIKVLKSFLSEAQWQVQVKGLRAYPHDLDTPRKLI